ncbi:MAG: DUF423 domain-containing protein [Dokdonella sp.]
MLSARSAGIAGALFGALAVVLGAFGTHALRNTIGADAMSTWRTAVDYQFWHALILVAAAALGPGVWSGRTARLAVLAYVVGIVLFSGSLFALALGAPRMLGAITPLGGVALMAGWVLLAAALVRTPARL